MESFKPIHFSSYGNVKYITNKGINNQLQAR